METPRPRASYNATIAAILKAEYERQDYGPARLSRATNIPRGSLRRYLDGERPISVENLRAICDALRLRVGDVTDAADADLKE